ncbi:hypothetical protein ACJA29_03890 [Metamycoplasma sualvi]|uniref:hypothetical protein n=1 Tax=Metamycoplasma sualvi TaxID=2125 RepID=UPI0038738DE1
MKNQNKNKSLKIKNKIILPLATVLSASSIALVFLFNTTQNVNNNTVVSLANDVSSNSKSISSNASQKNNLIGPHELFYLSTKLNSSVNVWEDSSNSENTTNSESWKKFKENLEALAGSSSIKDELITIADQALNVKSIKSIYKQIEELKKTNTWMTDAMIQSLKDTIKDQTGYVESMNEIAGIDDIPSKLLSLSGIEEGTKISSLTTVGNANMLIRDLSSTQNTTGTVGTIGSVAGQDYKYLAKIAEIDPTVEGSYALTFNWKKTASSSNVSGTLFINNKSENGQLPLNQYKDNISTLTSTLDVFGRWNLGANGTLGSGNYDQSFENFVIQKGTDNTGKEVIEVLVRLKDNQTISNIQWGTDATIPGAVDLKTGSRLGILDVQANDKNTFRSAILGTFATKATPNNLPTVGKLISDINANCVKTVSFFSNTLTSKKITKSSKAVEANRNLTFWQYGNLEYSLPLYYAVGSESDIARNTITYNPISIYSNGSATSAQQTIILNSTENNPTDLSPTTYSMFSELKNKLPDAVKADFVSASKISLKSSLYSSQKFTKQELSFYDNFYAIGNRDEGWNSVDVSGDVKFIKIQDPTQKIFFEDPFPTTSATPSSVRTTEIQAQETINERTAVIGFLGNVYQQFSLANSGDLAGETYRDLRYGKWVPKGSNYSNIVYENSSFTGSANQLYNLLNNTWKAIRPAMDKLFGIITNDGRYDATQQTAQTVVTSYLAFVSEFTADSSKLESLITEAITKVKEEVTNITEQTTYDTLSSNLKKSLGVIMSKLIQLQLDTISNEFKLRLSTPLYNAIKDVISNTANKVSFTVNATSSFLETTSSTGNKKLIKYTNNGWDNITSNTESTLMDAVQKMLQILYFNNNNGNTTVYLGNSIFNTGNLQTLFNSYSPTSLTSFVSDSYQTQNEKVAFYAKLFSVFTNYNLQSKAQEMLKTGSTSSINSAEITSAFKDMLLKITNQVQRIENIKEDVVKSYYLDDLISGANAIIALKWKLEQLSTTTFSSRAGISQKEANDIQQNIQNILNSNEQISSSELSIWSNLILSSYNYAGYTENLSGRNGDSALMSMVDKIVDNNTLLAVRAQETVPAIVALEYLIKYIWWPIIALIGLGIVVSSSVGLATKDRKVKLSARPVVKWLLVASIILGLGVLALSILLGLPILGLPTIL